MCKIVFNNPVQRMKALKYNRVDLGLCMVALQIRGHVRFVQIKAKAVSVCLPRQQKIKRLGCNNLFFAASK